MSMNLDAAIRLTAKVDGANNIKALSGGLQQLNASTALSKASLGRWNVEINRSAREAGNTTAGIRAHATALTQLRDRVEIGSKSYARLSREIETANSKLRALNSSAAQSPRGGGGGFGGLLAAGAAGAGAFAAFQASQQIGATVNTGIDLEQSRTRLKALSAGFDEYTAVQQRAIQVGEKFNLQQLDANNSFAQLYARLRPLGIELDTITSIYGGFNTAAKLAGTSSTEASAAFIQLSQALGSGVLRGEELNSVYEQTPAVIREIAEVMGLPIGQLREYAKEGKITSDIVITALGNIEREGAQKLAESMNGPREQVALLQREFQGLQDEVGRAVMPAIVGAVRLLTGQVEGLTVEVQNTRRAFDILAESPVAQFFRGIGIVVQGLNVDLNQTASLIMSLLPGVGAMQALGPLRDFVLGGRSGNGLLPGASGLTLRSSAADYPSLPSSNAIRTQVGAAVGGGAGGGRSAGGGTGSRRENVGLVQLARSVGFGPQDAIIMAAIARAESSGNPRAFNGNAATGDQSYGLWQINMLGGMGPERRRSFGIKSNDQLFDPVTNASAAKKVFDSQGFGAWSVYRSGAYRNYLGKDMNVPGLSPSGMSNDLSGQAFSAFEQEEELKKQRLEGIRISNEELAQSRAQLQIDTTSNELERLRLEYAEKRRKLVEEFNGLAARSLSPEQDQNLKERRDLEDAILRNSYEKEYSDILEKQNELWRKQGEALAEVTAQAFEFARARQEGADIRGGFNDGISGYLDGIGTIRSSVTDLANNAFTGLENALVDLVTTGKAGFKELAASILADTARMIIQQYVLANVLQGVRGLLGGGGGGGLPAFAPGLNLGTSFGGSGFNPAAFSPGMDLLGGGGGAVPIPVVPFARGGVIDSPTLFKFANGGGFRNGLMGEAGPEAIMPLRRGPDGKLGVAGGGTSVVVNVNMQTGQSDVESSEDEGRRLGRAVSEAVQVELIKQRRAGGALYR